MIKDENLELSNKYLATIILFVSTYYKKLYN